MNKKALILLAMAATLASPSANAVSNITGVTSGGSGTFDIKADFVGKNGGQGFKKYTDFTVGSGDVANLLFDGYTKNGTAASITTFINLVQNQVNVQGVVNTMKSSGFYNGHAVFITPNGMVVGGSGVLNVGRLSVVTPNGTQYNNMADKFQALLDEPTQSNATAFQNTGVLNFLSNSKTGASWGSNGEIDVQGKIFAREGVVLRGSDVKVSGSVTNGLPTNYNAAYSASLFDALVNTSGVADKTGLANSSQVVIESSGGMNVTGNVLNMATGGSAGTYITNNGANGMNVSGEAYSKGVTRLYNTKGGLSVGNGAKLQANEVQVLNNGGTTLSLGAGSQINAGTAKIYNHGSGALTTAGTITTTNGLAIKNEAGKTSDTGMTIGGTINSSGDVAIKNYDGAMVYSADLTSGSGNVGLVNLSGNYTTTSGQTKTASGTTMGVGGTITNTSGIVNIKNQGSGALTVSGTINNTATNGQNGQPANNETKNTTTYITNKTGNGLTVTNTAKLTNTNGDLAINNYKGDMAVNGTIKVTKTGTNKANLGIIDRTGGGGMTVAADITNSGGNTVIKKESGTTGDMAVNGKLTHDGYMAILNNEGNLSLGATVVNNGGQVNQGGKLGGGFYAITRGNGTGLTVTDSFNGTGSGEYLIKNLTGNNGFSYAGTINTTGTNQVGLVNREGNFNVGGSIEAEKIIVRSGTSKLDATGHNDPSQGTFTVNGTLKPRDKSSSYIVNWYEEGPSGASDKYAVNGDPENGKMYKTNGSDIEIRQEKISRQ